MRKSKKRKSLNALYQQFCVFQGLEWTFEFELWQLIVNKNYYVVKNDFFFKLVNESINQVYLERLTRR